MNGYQFVPQDIWQLISDTMKLIPAILLTIFALHHYVTKHELYPGVVNLYKKWLAWRGDIMTKNVMIKVEEFHNKAHDSQQSEFARLESQIKSVHDELVRDESVILQEIKKVRKDAAFKADSLHASQIRLLIKELVEEMTEKGYIPVNKDLADEYYDMCLWYIKFCEAHSDKDSEYYYDNGKMVAACKAYMDWYEKKYLNFTKED